MEYRCDNLLGKLNFLTLHSRRRQPDVFLINIFIGSKCCPYVPETVGLRVPTRNISNFTRLSVSSNHCPLAS
jgi:hypothetical protein